MDNRKTVQRIDRKDLTAVKQAVDYTAGDAAILAKLRKLKWEKHDNYYSTPIHAADVDRFQTFFENVGSFKRADGIAFENVEAAGSRITAVLDGPKDNRSAQYEIRLTEQDMKQLGISTNHARTL